MPDLDPLISGNNVLGRGGAVVNSQAECTNGLLMNGRPFVSETRYNHT